jgi:DNA-binding NarL/FixJ family response regulator
MGYFAIDPMSVGRRPRVLLADDFPDLLIEIGRLLTPDCEVVGTVGDGGALVAAAERLQPDLIVLDLNLPTLSGLEACRRITKSNPRVKVILMTAGRDTVLMGAAFAAGASGFIEKHAIDDDLLAAIKAAWVDCED